MIRVAAGIFCKVGDHGDYFVWMQQRSEPKHLKGLWEFPGGKIRKGESSKAALYREILEEVEFDASHLEQRVQRFKVLSYSYPENSVIVTFYLIPVYGSDKLPDLSKFGEWKRINHLEGNDKLKQIVLPANKVLVDDLSQYFQSLSPERKSWTFSAQP